ncbi:hypothetical protein BDAP_001256 [Binucleata daphniae]
MIKYSEFKINDNHEFIVFYNVNESELVVYHLKNLKYRATIKLKEKIVCVNINANIILIVSRSYIRGVNIYTFNTELFIYIKHAKYANLLKNNKLLVEFDEQLFLYSVYNQIEHKFYFEDYKIFGKYVLVLQSGVITIFDDAFIVVNEYKVKYDSYSDFTLYKKRIVYMVDKKIVGRNYNIDLKNYFDKTPEKFYMTKRYIYIINDGKVYVYDKKGNKNKPLYLLANDKCNKVQKRKKNKLIESINYCCAKELSCVKYDSYHLCSQMFITKHKNKLTYYRELNGSLEAYVNADKSCRYLPGECDFDTSSEN